MGLFVILSHLRGMWSQVLKYSTAEVDIRRAIYYGSTSFKCNAAVHTLSKCTKEWKSYQSNEKRKTRIVKISNFNYKTFHVDKTFERNKLKYKVTFQIETNSNYYKVIT